MSDGTYQRLTSGMGQFALAIGACFALVLVVVLISPGNGIISPGGPKEILPSVDPSQGAAALRLAAPYPAYAPQGLPARWRPTSSRLQASSGNGGNPVSWHLGYVTPSNQYAALEESNEEADAFITRMTNIDPTKPANLRGIRQVGGANWDQYYRVDKKQYSLVRRLPGVTLLVTGTADYDELAVLAGSLQPLAKPGGATPSPGAATAAAPRSSPAAPKAGP